MKKTQFNKNTLAFAEDNRIELNRIFNLVCDCRKKNRFEFVIK